MGVLDLFRLDGKVALVTGCKRGIGRAMAVALAEAGADVVGVSASLEPSGSAVAKDVQACGRRFSAYSCNFFDRAAVYEFVRCAKAEHPRVDILVNNAGIIKRAPATEYSDADWDEVIEVNLNAQFILAREFGRDMVERGTGKIVFTASLLTFQGGITVPAYAASKGALGQLTMALSNEWSAKGVQVNAIAPGYIATDNTAPLQANEERNRAILQRIPSSRWGVPADLMGATVFLASAASNYVTGAIVPVDGGWLGR